MLTALKFIRTRRPAVAAPAAGAITPVSMGTEAVEWEATGTTMTVPLPSGWVAGQYAVCCAEFKVRNTSQRPQITSFPSGWTKLAESGPETDYFTKHVYSVILGRQLTAGNSPPTFGIAWGTFGSSRGVVLTFTNVDPTTPVADSRGTLVETWASGNRTLAVGGLVPGGVNRVGVVVTGWAEFNSSGTGSVSPAPASGWGEVFRDSSGWAELTVSTRDYPASTTTPSQSHSFSVSTDGTICVAMTELLLRPLP